MKPNERWLTLHHPGRKLVEVCASSPRKPFCTQKKNTIRTFPRSIVSRVSHCACYYFFFINIQVGFYLIYSSPFVVHFHHSQNLETITNEILLTLITYNISDMIIISCSTKYLRSQVLGPVVAALMFDSWRRQHSHVRGLVVAALMFDLLEKALMLVEAILFHVLRNIYFILIKKIFFFICLTNKYNL